MDKILSPLEQTISLLDQTSISISYHRNYNILSSMCSQKKMLRNKVELLQIYDENLFGKKFSDYLAESVKSKKSSKEVFLKFLALRFNSNIIRVEEKSKSLRMIEAMKQNKIGAAAGKTRIFKVVALDIKVKVSPTQLFLCISPITHNVELVNVHPLTKRFFL